MSEFEEYVKARYPVDYESLQEKYPNVPVSEFYGDEQDLWNLKQAEIDQLKAQMNNMESCYIEKKKEGDELKQALKHLSEMNNKSISYEHDLFDKGWNQCAKQTVENIFRLTGVGVGETLRGENENENEK